MKVKCAPNAAQIAKIINNGNHLYVSSQDIAAAYFLWKKYSYTAKEIDSIIEQLNSQAPCFNVIEAGGQKKYSLIHFPRWYSMTVDKNTKRQKQCQSESKAQINNYFDIFYYDWMMDGHGCPILYQACFYALDDVNFFEHSTNYLYKLAEWAESTPDDVAAAMQRAIDAAWAVRQRREHVIPKISSEFQGQTPEFMTWIEFLKRIISFITNKVPMENAYLLIWFDHPKMTEMYEKTQAERCKFQKFA